MLLLGQAYAERREPHAHRVLEEADGQGRLIGLFGCGFLIVLGVIEALGRDAG